MRYISALCFIFLCSIPVFAQSENETRKEDQNQRKNFEIGIDVTSALSKFVGNEALEFDDTPFLLRFHNKKGGALRLGIGGIINRGEFVDVIAGIVRQTNTTAGSLRLGFEKNVRSTAKLTFYYGIDLLAYYEKDIVSAATFNPVELIKTTNRIGLGPLIGISYYINPKIRLTTEASLSVFIENSETIESFNGIEQVVSSDSGISGSVNPPFSLFINARF